MQSSNQFKTYVAKLKYVEAVIIDESWAEFLKKEHGYTSVKSSDYYVKQCDGSYTVLTKERFERLFEEYSAVNMIQQVNNTLEHLTEVNTICTT